MDSYAAGSQISIMNGDAPRKRRRPALACDVCRRRKIRCDRQMPCNHCTRSKSATCTYTQDLAPALRTRPVGVAASSTTSSPRSSGSRPGTFHLTPDGSLSSTSHVTVPSNSSRTVSLVEGQSGERMTDRVPALENPYSGLTVQELVDRVHKLEQMLSDTASQPSAEPENVPITLPRTTPHTRGNFSKTRFYGHSHWANSIEPVRAIIFHD
jgi:Fungal Zn(2)-Cys(6) binuclear cluster domain